MPSFGQPEQLRYRSRRLDRGGRMGDLHAQNRGIGDRFLSNSPRHRSERVPESGGSDSRRMFEDPRFGKVAAAGACGAMAGEIRRHEVAKADIEEPPREFVDSGEPDADPVGAGDFRGVEAVHQIDAHERAHRGADGVMRLLDRIAVEGRDIGDDAEGAEDRKHDLAAGIDDISVLLRRDDTGETRQKQPCVLRDPIAIGADEVAAAEYVGVNALVILDELVFVDEAGLASAVAIGTFDSRLRTARA